MAKTSIRVLPPEIILSIFEKGCEDEVDEDEHTDLDYHFRRLKPFASVMKRVCSQWRGLFDLADSSQHSPFWIARTGITLHSATENRLLAKDLVHLLNCLRSSSGCDLVIRFFDYTPESVSEYDLDVLSARESVHFRLFIHGIHLLTPYLDQLVTLKLITSQTQVFKHLLMIIAHIPANSRFTSLHLRHSFPFKKSLGEVLNSEPAPGFRSIHAPRIPQDEATFAKVDLPRLKNIQTLVLSRLSWMEELNLPTTIVNLTLWDAWSGEPSANPMLAFFMSQSFDYLVSLRIISEFYPRQREDSITQDGSHKTSSIISMKSLRRLVIEVEPGKSSDVLLACGAFPKLERLELHYRDGDDPSIHRELSSALIQPIFSLQHLHITFPFLSPLCWRMAFVLELLSWTEIKTMKIYCYHDDSVGPIEDVLLKKVTMSLSLLRSTALQLTISDSTLALVTCLGMDFQLLKTLEVTLLGLPQDKQAWLLLTHIIEAPLLSEITLSGLSIADASLLFRVLKAGNLQKISVTFAIEDTVHPENREHSVQPHLLVTSNYFYSVWSLYYSVPIEGLSTIERFWKLTPNATSLSLHIRNYDNTETFYRIYLTFWNLTEDMSGELLPSLSYIDGSFYLDPSVKIELVEKALDRLLEGRRDRFGGQMKLQLRTKDNGSSPDHEYQKVEFQTVLSGS